VGTKIAFRYEGNEIDALQTPIRRHAHTPIRFSRPL
jgi:hypothetical protein